MTTTVVREGPPIGFPAAKLFLDDLDEIIRVFRESRKYAEHPDAIQELILSIRFRTWQCDSLDDLRQLGKKASKDFSLDVADEWRFSGTFYISGKTFAGWSDTRLSDDGKWLVYGQLRSIVEKRKFRWTLWRRPQVIFEKSYEHKGILPALRRHATNIAVAAVTAVVTLVARELIEKLIHYLRVRN
jgi:hypothetical protein